MTDYEATPALLAAANEAVRCLAEENRALAADASAVKAVLNLLDFCEQLSARPAADSAALLAAATETIRTLDAENADLHGEIRTLREQIEELTRQRDEARSIAVRYITEQADLTRQRDDARDLAVRCGAFHNSVGADYHAHLDGTWPMELVDPGGELFK